MLMIAAPVVVSVVVSLASSCNYPTFQTWSFQQGKFYSPTERDYRESVYYANVRTIDAHNEQNFSWTMDVNQFADLTADEFKSMYTGGFRPTKNRTTSGLRFQPPSSLPVSVNWTASGAVTPVKNQEQCGSCWAFSSTGSIESAWFLKNGSLVSLSEQQLVDCSTAEGNQGCNGGLMDDAFEFVLKTKSKYDLIIIDIFQDTIMPNFLFEDFFINRMHFILNFEGFILFNTMVINEKDRVRNLEYKRKFNDNYSLRMYPKVEEHNELFTIKKLIR